MKLSVVIPCYNEASTIETIIDAVRNSPYDPKEIIVVDDCSNDGTREILPRLAHKIDKILYHDANSGKGAALRTGFREASGDIVIVQDADLEYDPAEYLKIIQSIDIEENRFGFEPEITAKLAKKKCRIYEVGISYSGRTYEEGKKIGWKDGFRAIYCILKYKFVN